MVKILYAEDVEFLRRGITADLSEVPEFEVSSCDLNYQETIQHVASILPDVLLLDVMSPTNIHEGLNIAKKLADTSLRSSGKLNVLLLTIFRADDDSVKQVVEKGYVDGIITKPTTSENIIQVIRQIIGN